MKYLHIILLLVALPIIGIADVVQFQLLDDAAIYTVLDDQASGTVTNGGIRVTLVASSGELNRTTSGFGINGPGTDDSDALNLDQYIDLTFDLTVQFKNVDVSSWGAGSDGEVRLGMDNTFTNQGNISTTGDTAFDFKVNMGQTVRIYATGETSPTNGFSVDSFSVEAIPEPAVVSLVLLFGSGLLVMRRVLG
ncbi:hypothetical protein P4C99_10015 [Pontiellaceae bacterium B1224]|nr:hypothetical protein [Pontiellaceae bacterium B1224]